MNKDKFSAVLACRNENTLLFKRHVLLLYKNAPQLGRDRSNDEATFSMPHIHPIAEIRRCDPPAFPIQQVACIYFRARYIWSNGDLNTPKLR